MPIYMDVHMVPGVKARGVAEAHSKDLLHQDEYACKCMTYWIDEERESIFCLIEAPDKNAVEEMHSKAHGLIPNKIIEVKSSLVESFLGRIYDPSDIETTDNGLKVFADPSFRVLMLTRTTDPVLLAHQMGEEKAAAIRNKQNTLIREKLREFGGREVEQEGSDFLISFQSAANAVSCGLSLLEALHANGGYETGFRIGISAGEPVANSDTLFGDTVQLASSLCAVTGVMQVAVSVPVKELVSKDLVLFRDKRVYTLMPDEETLLQSLFKTLENNWRDAEFDLSEYSGKMAMSKSQLYRKVVSLTGFSPNQFVKNYRLDNAREMMKKKRFSISQITFESGFSSPSYFTKCFKKQFGLLPMAYLDQLH